MGTEKKVPRGQACPLIYPSIKEINALREIKVDIVKNDILPQFAEKAIYFCPDYRFEKIVMDGIAHKYNATVETYPADEDEEHFLLGSTACEESASQLTSCPYMQKAWQVLQQAKISRKKIFAIYLLGLNESEENGQKFIARTKDKIYMRWNTKKLESAAYQAVIFTSEGIRSQQLIAGLEGENDGYLLRFDFAEAFVKFAQEIHLLKMTHLSGIEETHPARGLADEKRLKYIAFLTEAAAGSGKLNARRLLHLEYVAREFRIASSVLKKHVSAAGKRRMPDNKLAKAFWSIDSSVLPEELRYVFYQEVLACITADSGEMEREKLYHLVKQAAGDSFVAAYREFLNRRRLAESSLCAALQYVRCPELNLRALYRLQRYNAALELQHLKIGVTING